MYKTLFDGAVVPTELYDAFPVLALADASIFKKAKLVVNSSGLLSSKISLAGNFDVQYMLCDSDVLRAEVADVVRNCLASARIEAVINLFVLFRLRVKYFPEGRCPDLDCHLFIAGANRLARLIVAQGPSKGIDSLSRSVLLLLKNLLEYSHEHLPAYVIRCKINALDLKTFRLKKSIPHAIRVARLSLELGWSEEFERAFSFLNEARGESCDLASTLEEFRQLNALFQTVNPYVLKVTNASTDDPFNLYIEDKSVAIVGPSVLSLRDAQEVCGFDVVVRLGWVDPDRFQRAFEERRPDIVYLNANKQYAYADDIAKNAGLFQFLKFPESLVGKDCLPSNAVSYQVVGVLAFGFPNLFQNAIIDIIKNRPKTIKVFGVDLYTTQGYSIDYKNEFAGYFCDIAPGLFVKHDSVGNFMFAKRLRNAKLFDCDRPLSALLDGCIIDYLTKLDKLFNH